MKNLWRKYKKLIVGGTALVMVVAIVLSQVMTNEKEAEAASLFCSMDTYLNTSGNFPDNLFTILEIVPETYEHDEMGTFVKGTLNAQNAVHNSTASNYFNKTASYFRSYIADDANVSAKKHLDTLLEMRVLGLVKKGGMAIGGNNTQIVEYPIYATYNGNGEAIFSEAQDGNGSFSEAPFDKYVFAYGNYTENTSHTGKYKLKEGYFVGDDGFIYNKDGKAVSANTIPDKPTVTDDDSDDENTDDETDDTTVSDNDIDTGANRNTGDSSDTTDTDDSDETNKSEDTDASQSTDDAGNEEESKNTVDSKQEENKDTTSKTFKKTAMIEGGAEEVTIDWDALEVSEPETEMEEENENNDSDSVPLFSPTYNYSTQMYYTNDTLPVSSNDLRVLPNWSLSYYRKGGEEPPYKPLPEGVIYCGTGGDLDFTMNNNGLYWGYTTAKTFYVTNQNVIYQNADWFKALVFGDRASNIGITIKTKAADKVTKADIEKANLIYVSGTADEFALKNVDISNEVLKYIYNLSVVGNGAVHKAVMMDYLAYSGTTFSEESKNIDRLAALLWQPNQKDAVSEVGNRSLYFTESGAIAAENSLLADNTVFLDLQNNMLTGVDGNFVTGNVYVYNHEKGLFKNPKCMVDANDLFANGDFNSAYKDSVVEGAFANVEAYVTSNNTQHPEFAVAENNITPALIIQYILSTDGSTAAFVKNTINVLEIQPTAAFKFNEDNFESKQYAFCKEAVKTNRDAFITSYVNADWVKNSKQGYVSFTSMTVNEFICRNENIGEEYDIIYIGSEIRTNINTGTSYNEYLKNTTTNYSWDRVSNRAKKGVRITTFSDTSMNGMVYFNIGDKTACKNSNIGAFLSDETANSIKFTRYSGRDLNTEKLNQLKTYLSSGHPVIVAADLMSSDSTGKTYYINPTAYKNPPSGNVVDNGRIDNSSKMYEFFEYALHKKYDKKEGRYVLENGSVEANDTLDVSAVKYANFISEGDVTRGLVSIEEISKFLNTPKLYLEIGDMPTEYNYELKTVNGQSVIDKDSISYLQKADDGSYYLDYEFTISGIAATDHKYNYTVKLFVDVNADGKYSSDEECNDAVVTYAANGREVERDEETGQYLLTEGTDYMLRRAVPENYTGIIPWCLRAQLSTDENIQTNETGYTCIKAEQEGVIKILQIRQASYNNLQSDIANNTGFGPYLKELADHKVYVKTISVSQYVNSYKTDAADKGKTAMEYFDDYEFGDVYAGAGKGIDMLVLGFGDDYSEISDANGAVRAIKSFIDSGRPVLLTHDFLMFYNRAQEKQLRNVLGLDKYGVTLGIDALNQGPGNGTSSWSETGKIAEGTGRTVAYQPGSARRTLLNATQGFTDSQILRYKNNAGTSYPSYNGIFNSYSNTIYMDQKYNVDQINDGQLTEYPYHIAKSFATTKTHAQYYQLDLESDSDNDGSTDTTVWYTMSYDSVNGSRTSTKNSLYMATPGDGANQYYIYNKGNVTYTGAGHNQITEKEEIKLFVNTLLAAYAASDQAPEVKFFETAESSSSELDSIAIPYDSTITKGVNEDGTVNTSVVDSSIQYNTQKGDYDYKFVDPNVQTVAAGDRTAVYFKATDSNFKKGTKRMSVKFFLEVKEQPGEYFTMSDNTSKRVESRIIDGVERNVVELEIKVFETDLLTPVPNHVEIVNAQGVSTTKSDIASGKMYAMFLPLSYLREKGAISIYAEAQTFVDNVSTSGAITAEVNEKLGYGKLDVTKVDLMKLD